MLYERETGYNVPSQIMPYITATPITDSNQKGMTDLRSMAPNTTAKPMNMSEALAADGTFTNVRATMSMNTAMTSTNVANAKTMNRCFPVSPM